MGQENKKPTINKNTPNQRLFTVSSSQTNRPETDNQISQAKADYQARFRVRLQQNLKPINYLLSDNEIRIIAAKITAKLLEISFFFEIPTKERKNIEDEIINELLRTKTKELENSRTAEQEKRANYRLERDKLWDKYFEEKELKGYEDNDENDKRLLADLEWQLELLRKNFNYEGFNEDGHWKAESTDDETESNTENFSPPEDYSDDEETEQTAEQSNEVIPVIPEITPDQYLYAPGEKEQYEEVIPVIEKVIEVVEEVIPKKNKEKAKETEPEQSELSDWESQEIERLEKELLRLEKLQEAELENNEFIPPFIPFIPSINTEEPEQVEPEASTSKSTEPIEPKELSAESQQIIKLVNEVLISDPTEPSGKDIADYFNEPEAETKPKNSLTKFIKKINIPSLVENPDTSKNFQGFFYSKTPKDNRLYYLSKEDKAKWAREYRGTDRIIAERLRQKIGTYQISTADKIATPFIFSLPFYGNLLSSITPFTIDNLKIELEHSFSPAEVKEIVRQSNKESHEKLQGVENLLIRMEQENSGKIADLQNNTTNQIKDKDTEIKKLKQQALDFIVEKQKLEKQKAEALGQKKKAIESKEKVELTEITEKYRILEQNATQQEELLELKDKKITEFLAFIYQLEQEKEILGGEFSILIDRVLRIEAEKLLLDSELFAKSNELKRTIDEKDREIKRITDSKDRELKEQYDALDSLTKDRTDLTNLLKTRDDELSQADREYQELEKDLKTPEIIHNFLYWIDWGLKTNLRKNTQSFWTKTKLIFRFSLLILVSLILLLIFTIIIRVLIAVYRNAKAIFTKKQDTASILKELIGGMKQAKDNLTNKKPTETTAKTKEKPEPKNIIEILPEFTEQEKKENLRKLPPEERQIIKEAKKRAKLKKSKKLRTKRTKEPTK